jgi:uncharacterized protein (DUF885 family)
MKLRLVLLLAAAGLVSALAGAARAESADARMQKLGDAYLDGWLARRPQIATRLGLHEHDGEIRPITSTSVASDLAWLAGMGARLRAIPRASLSFDRAQEYDLLGARLERERLELAEVRSWKRNPNVYLDLVAGSILAVLERDFASPCDRAQFATGRLRAVPEVLRAARINLESPPRIFTEVAIAQFGGTLEFYRGTIRTLTADCRDPGIQADLAEADSAAVRAVEQFITVLREDVLPRSNGTFALGRDLYQRKLAADEMEMAPVESLLARGQAELEATRARMETLAGRIAPGGGIAAALDTLARDAPREAGLVAFVSARLDTVRSFLRAQNVLTLPPQDDLAVRETPSFQRGLSFASMDAPGVWEKRATRAWFNVTPVDPRWTEAQKRDHLGFFNRASTEIVTIHEALPGHYYQFLALQRVPSRLRQALRCGSNSEGWAHYCEQMMVERGWGGGDLRTELAQLELALQRLGRLIVGISLHTRGMTLEEAQQLFEKRCFMGPVNAAREARRGALDPTYLVYSLGKWRILGMRDEARALLGPGFSLREFHDTLLRQGGVPLPLAREAVLRELARRHRAPSGARR